MKDMWLAFNDPFFTDKEPYCNKISFITAADAIAYMRRGHPGRYDEISDRAVLEDFIVVNEAWRANDPTRQERTTR